MGNYCVYKHTSPSGKVYIGITHKEPRERWKNGLGYRTQKRFYRAIVKYGWDSFTHEILFSGLSEQEAKDKEVALIAIYESSDKSHGYNVTLGGESMRGYIPPQEVREKISKANKGRKKPDTMRERLSAAKTGTHPSEAARLNMSRNHADISGDRNPMYQKNHSEDSRRKMSENRPKRSVCQFSINGELIAIHSSTREAERKTGVNHTHIGRCCKKTQRSAGGFVWKYKTEVENECTISI